MKNLDNLELTEISGGGPILDGINWYYRTMGSFYHGLYDGIVGNKPCL